MTDNTRRPPVIALIQALRYPWKSLHTSLVLVATLIIVSISAVYATRPGTTFVLDDDHNIVDNERVHMESFTVRGLLDSMTDLPTANRPLPFATFAIDWLRSAGSPAAFYQTNIALHIVQSLLVLAFCLQCLGSFSHASPTDKKRAYLAAGLGTAFWALHPIQVSAVAYAVQRMAILAALFSTAAVVAYICARRTGNRPTRVICSGLCLVMLALGALSKENAWMTPLLLLMAEIGIIKRPQERLLSRRIEQLLVAASALTALIVATDIVFHAGPFSAYLDREYADWEFTLKQRLLTEPRVIAFHLSQILWPAPSRFAITHDLGLSTGWLSPPSTLFAVLLVLFWIAGGVALFFRPAQIVGKRPNYRLIGFLLLWAPVLLAVESTVMPLDIVFEHRMYLPSVAVAALITLAAMTIRRTSRLFILLALIIVALGWTSTRYLQNWESRFVISENIAKHAPGLTIAQLNYANVLLRSGQFALAAAHYKKALEIKPPSPSKVLTPSEMASVYFNLSIAQRQLGQKAEAKTSLLQAEALNPWHLKTLAALAETFLAENDIPGVQTRLLRLVALDPANRNAAIFLNRIVCPEGSQPECSMVLGQKLQDERIRLSERRAAAFQSQ